MHLNMRLKRKLMLGAMAVMVAIAPMAMNVINIGESHKSTAAFAQSSSGSLNLQWLGHMSFLITGNGNTILTHPFKPAGCTANFPEPKQKSDLVLISSRLLDEGYVVHLDQKTKLLYQPGAYSLINTNFQGIRMDHDRIGGKRFGVNVAWKWEQAGVSVLHLGGAAAPIEADQRILMGKPDVLIIPVGGGPKAYNAAEAAEVVNSLQPKLVIPTQYRTSGANQDCELGSIDEFLELLPNVQVRKVTGSSLSISATNLPQTTTVMVLTPPVRSASNSQ
jgi:L-ascorbate metabolism protein UlaG (beta-lactamase superfamily)